MTMESSSAVYDDLSQILAGKGLKSLENIKSACDLVVISQGIMNYSSVAKVATEQFGGPQKQSVQNNKSLKRYINARIQEYMQAKRNHQFPTKKNSEPSKAYPVDNLDPRSKTYIDQLHSRLDLAEARYSELRKWQEDHTHANPLNLAEAIGRGPSDVGVMQLEHKLGDDKMLNRVKQAVRELLRLTDFIGTLEIEEQGEKKRLTLKRPAGDHVVLSPQLYEAVEHLWDNSDDA